jgi:hypothetical protein
MTPQPLSPRPLVECPACGGPLKSVGRLPVLRAAAMDGTLAFGQPGDAAPTIVLDAYRCHECGRLEWYDHDFQLPAG